MSNTTPVGWRQCSFNQVFSEIKNGCSLDQNGVSEGIPVTRIETISKESIDYKKTGWLQTTENIDRFKIEKGDILFSHINSLKHIGKTAIKKDDRILYHGMNLLRLKVHESEFSPHFIHYLLTWDEVREAMRRKAKQAINQASLNVQDIKASSYLMPPLPEQRKIATILSSVDNTIETTRAQIDKLKDLKTGMMQELLTKGIGHTEFKDSPVGRIPLGWGVESITNISKVGSSKRILQSEYVAQGVPFFRSKEVIRRAKGLEIEKTLYITKERFEELARKFGAPKESDILITAVGTIGVVYLVENRQFYFKDGNLLWLKNIKSSVTATFLAKVMQSEAFQKRIDLVVGGSSQSALTIEKLDELLVPIPPKDEQAEIVRALSSVDEILSVSTKKLAALVSAKKALMQDLLTGKVRVKIEEKGKEPAVV